MAIGAEQCLAVKSTGMPPESSLQMPTLQIFDIVPVLPMSNYTGGLLAPAFPTIRCLNCNINDQMMIRLNNLARSSLSRNQINL